jgi:hypothetical protein
MADIFFTIMETIKFIKDNYDQNMTRIKLYSYTKRGWFDVVEYPGGTPRIKRASVIEAYENPPPSKRYPYRGTRLIDPAGEVPEPLEAPAEVDQAGG